jgi:hypothetical protein
VIDVRVQAQVSDHAVVRLMDEGLDKPVNAFVPRERKRARQKDGTLEVDSKESGTA